MRPNEEKWYAEVYEEILTTPGPKKPEPEPLGPRLYSAAMIILLILVAVGILFMAAKFVIGIVRENGIVEENPQTSPVSIVINTTESSTTDDVTFEFSDFTATRTVSDGMVFYEITYHNGVTSSISMPEGSNNIICLNGYIFTSDGITTVQ